MKKYDICSCIRSFNAGRNINARYASYDLCYGYFQNNRSNLDIEKSCLYLWGYLASWGMLRGSSALLQCSPAALRPLIEYFDSIKSDAIWDYDVIDYPNHSNEIINVYNEIGVRIQQIMKKKAPPTPTLITKIMLGVFGCIPAFDTYFRKAFRAMYADYTLEGPHSSFDDLGQFGFNCIYNFYEDNKKDINAISIQVLNFDGTKSGLKYKKAKLIDMYGFTKGICVDNTLSGKFSVSDTQQVQFSKGNLQYYFDENIFRFADNQYDVLFHKEIRGYTEIFLQEYSNTWVDRFAFGTGNKPFFNGVGDKDVIQFDDWGNYIREDDGSTPWRTLTSDEWNYLLFKRVNAQNLLSRATVFGVNGIILLPDDWQDDKDFVVTDDDWNILKAKKINQVHYTRVWEMMTAKGAVFLPGCLNHEGNDCGCYWSSTTSPVDWIKMGEKDNYTWYAGFFEFTQNSKCVICNCSTLKCRKINKYAVRLVRNCETKE